MVASGLNELDFLEQSYDGHLREVFGDGLSLSGYERDFVAFNLRGKKYMTASGVSGADSVRDARSGVAYADFDNDGDLDILRRPANNPEASLELYRNNIGTKKHFLRLSLEGRSDESGRDAWGTVVRITTQHGTQTKMKAAGSGFMAQWDPRLLFGLGSDARSGSIEVTWPSGLKQTFSGMEADTAILIVEGEARPRVLREKRASLPDPISAEEKRWLLLNIEPTQEVPRLRLSSLDGENVLLSSLVAPGRRTIINFWATWCIPCRAEMPELQKFYEANLAIIGVSVDDKATRGAVPGFVDRIGVTYPTYVANTEDLELIFQSGIANVPLSLIIDEEGKIADAVVGWTAEGRNRLEKYLPSP